MHFDYAYLWHKFLRLNRYQKDHPTSRIFKIKEILRKCNEKVYTWYGCSIAILSETADLQFCSCEMCFYDLYNRQMNKATYLNTGSYQNNFQNCSNLVYRDGGAGQRSELSIKNFPKCNIYTHEQILHESLSWLCQVQNHSEDM